VMAEVSALEDEDAHGGREFLGLAAPVVQDGGGADDECGLGTLAVLRLEPEEPREGLQGFAETHVVGEDATQLHVVEVAEEIEAVLLIWPQFGLDSPGKVHLGNALEVGEALAQGAGLG